MGLDIDTEWAIAETIQGLDVTPSTTLSSSATAGDPSVFIPTGGSGDYRPGGLFVF